jgi:hypothetical protein
LSTKKWKSLRINVWLSILRECWGISTISMSSYKFEYFIRRSLYADANPERIAYSLGILGVVAVVRSLSLATKLRTITASRRQLIVMTATYTEIGTGLHGSVSSLLLANGQ